MSERDMISLLPADILDHILGFLPIQDAAKTSVLSKAWRDIWCSLTQLCFDDPFFRYINKRYRRASTYLRKSSGLYAINNILLHHSGTIRKLVICFSSARILSGRSWSFDIDQWLLLVTQKGVEEIQLCLGHKAYKLPNCLFSCLTLKRLHLDGFCIEPPTTPCKLPNATSLCFEYVEFGPGNLSNCALDVPMLENLSFTHCENMFQFNITADNIRSLTIKYSPGCQLGNFLPVNLDLISITTLDLADSSLEYFVAEHARIALPLNVEYLKLSEYRFFQSSAFVRLLRVCPKLCKLDINFWFAEATNATDEDMLNALEELHSVAQTLETLLALKLSSFTGSKFQMFFVKELLASLPALKKVIIIRPHFSSNEEYEIVQEVLHYPCASTEAKIVYAIEVE